MIALALLLWAPRFSGPIDLRWDAGVYYLLGTSLAKGEGYRIPSGAWRARGVAVFAAPAGARCVASMALGYNGRCDHSALAAEFLRGPLRGLLPGRACFGKEAPVAWIRLCGDGAVHAPHHDNLPVGPSVRRTSICVVSVVFTLVAASRLPASRPWVREVVSFTLAAIGFFLRTRYGAISCLGDGGNYTAPMAVGSRTWGAGVGAHHAMAGARGAGARE